MTDAPRSILAWLGGPHQGLSFAGGPSGKEIEYIRADVARADAELAVAEERLARAVEAREKIKAAYEELLATVHGECPSLINEDSGGSQVLLDLILAADEAITTIKELNE